MVVSDNFDESMAELEAKIKEELNEEDPIPKEPEKEDEPTKEPEKPAALPEKALYYIKLQQEGK